MRADTAAAQARPVGTSGRIPGPGAAGRVVGPTGSCVAPRAARSGARPAGPAGRDVALPAAGTARLGALAILCLTGACAPDSVAETPTSRMAERLERAAREVDPVRNRFANTALIEAMRELPPRETERERLLFRLALAEQILYAGRFREAIAELESLRGDLARFQAGAPPGAAAPPTFEAQLLEFLAVAWLRLGERRNCIEGVGPVACTMPVPPEGVHADREGARTAIPVFEELLARDPHGLGARWLLNLAHMMVGTWPEGVPGPWRIPEAVFASEHDVGRFANVAPALGVDDVGHVGGAVMDDFDGDGLLDLMATSWQLRDPIRYHRNRGDGTFEHLTGAAGLEGLWGGGNLVHADYDNDGDLDAFVLRGGWLEDGQPNSLLRNRGDGTFEDVTEEAGLLEPLHPGQTAAWLDYDGDGLLDLFVGNETFSGAEHPCQLFHNEGDGTFTDVAPEAGVAVVGIVKGVAAGDYDDDGRPDLYLTRIGAPNVLLHNDGPTGSGWWFSDRTGEAGVAEPVDAFPTWFWDYDNDGRLDLYAAGYRTRFGDVAAEYLGLPHGSELPRLYRNRGDGTFEDVTEAVGLDRIQFAMGSNYGDLDNDGWLDLYLGTGDAYFQALMPNRMFRNDGGRRFQDVTTSGGFGLVQKGHGVAFGDIDHDGDQDVFAAMGGAYEGDLARNVLFRNPGHGGRWLSIRLEGTRANRSAIGARVEVVVETASGLREVHRTVDRGSSFGGNPLRLDIGLGDALEIVSTTVDWPAPGDSQEVEGLRLDTAYRLREGGVAEVVERTPIRLGPT